MSVLVVIYSQLVWELNLLAGIAGKIPIPKNTTCNGCLNRNSFSINTNVVKIRFVSLILTIKYHLNRSLCLMNISK